MDKLNGALFAEFNSLRFVGAKIVIMEAQSQTNRSDKMQTLADISLEAAIEIENKINGRAFKADKIRRLDEYLDGWAPQYDVQAAGNIRKLRNFNTIRDVFASHDQGGASASSIFDLLVEMRKELKSIEFLDNEKSRILLDSCLSLARVLNAQERSLLRRANERRVRSAS